MYKYLKHIISAVVSVSIAVGMTSAYPANSIESLGMDNIPEDRYSASFDADVSYAIPAFKNIIGTEVEQIGAISPVANFGSIEENINISGTETELPDCFDLFEIGHGNSVKDQSMYEACWTFSSASSAETSLIDAIPSINLSEMHTVFYPYYSDEGIYIEELNNTESLEIMPFSELMDTGGTSFIVTNLWSQWKGPVDEDKLSYVDTKLFYDKDYAEKFYKMADYHLENAYMFDFNKESTNRDAVNNLIKQFLYSGYAVDVSFYTKSYDEKTNAAYSNYNHSLSNHCVSIIGWDDSFSASNFKGNTGAWLVKNNWGADFGDEGCFYISYEDTTIGDFVVYELNEKTNYATNYQHDSFIPTQAMAADNDASVNKPSYMANIFTAEETQQIEAVSTYILNPHTDYEITIYTDLKDMSDPTSGTSSAVTKGTSMLTGYLTFELSENVIVNKGESFAVVVSLYCNDSKYVLPVESSLILEKNGDRIENVLGGFSTYDQICTFTSENESFYSENGCDWTDVTSENYLYSEEEKNAYFEALIEEYKKHTVWLTISKEDIAQLQALAGETQIKVVMGNMSLKAFGNPVNTVDFSHIEGAVTSDERVSLTVKDDSDIYVSVNGGEYTLYETPIEITEETVISVTTDNITYTEKKYIPSKAEFNALMYSVKTGTESSYNAISAEKTADRSYEIILGGVENSISFIPYTGAEVYFNGERIEANTYTEDIELDVGKNVITFELKEKNKLDSTVTVIVYRDLVTFDLQNETVSLNDVSSLEAYDGHIFTDGESVSDYAGQELIATQNGEVYYVYVPERAEFPYLEVDYLNETLNFISNDIADSIVYSVKENPSEDDFIPAEKRYIDGQHITSGMIMNKAFRIIPGETVTLKVKASDGKFASIPQTFELKQVGSVPVEEPNYSVSEEYYEVERSNILEYGIVNEPITESELEYQADLFGYSTEEYKQLMMTRHGVADENILYKVMAIEWNAGSRFKCNGNQNLEIAVRYYCLDDEFASCMKFSELQYRMRGDVDCNGCVDAVDASKVLAYYASISTGKTPAISESQLYGYDFNKDDCIDASDASEILAYYAMKLTQPD